jgi:hypothetical protein
MQGTFEPKLEEKTLNVVKGMTPPCEAIFPLTGEIKLQESSPWLRHCSLWVLNILIVIRTLYNLCACIK